MSLADYNIDAGSLVLVQTGLAFIVAPFTAPVYNLPLFLFGFYAIDKTDSNDPLRLFLGLVGVSALFDLIWLIRHNYNGFIGFLVIIGMLLKGPTFLSVLMALRHRGYRFGALGRNFDDALANAPGNPVWGMPGGFGGPKTGYQNIDDDLEGAAAVAASGSSPPPPPVPPSRNPPAPPPGPSPHSHQSQVSRQ